MASKINRDVMKWPETIRVMQLKKQKDVWPARIPSELCILDPSDDEYDDQEERIYVLQEPAKKNKKS